MLAFGNGEYQTQDAAQGLPLLPFSLSLLPETGSHHPPLLLLSWVGYIAWTSFLLNSAPRSSNSPTSAFPGSKTQPYAATLTFPQSPLNWIKQEYKSSLFPLCLFSPTGNGVGSGKVYRKPLSGDSASLVWKRSVLCMPISLDFTKQVCSIFTVN